jgi:hypothetical protein
LLGLWSTKIIFINKDTKKKQMHPSEAPVSQDKNRSVLVLSSFFDETRPIQKKKIPIYLLSIYLPPIYLSLPPSLSLSLSLYVQIFVEANKKL